MTDVRAPSSFAGESAHSRANALYNEMVLRRFAGREVHVSLIVRYLRESEAVGLERGAEIAKDWEYTFDRNLKYQPWAEAANHALRAQNHEIMKRCQAEAANRRKQEI